MNITGSTRLAEITALFPAAKSVFEEHGLDPELLADTALADAVAGTGVSVPALIAEIRRAAKRERAPKPLLAEPEPLSVDPEIANTEDIVELIVVSCHPSMDRNLDANGALLAAAILLEGDDHPELYQTGRGFEQLRRLVRDQMAETRGIIFPQLLGTRPDEEPDSAARRLEAAHQPIREALQNLREAALQFEVPADAADEWRVSCLSLQDLEAEVQRLINLEALLLPGVRELDVEDRNTGD